VRKRPSLSSEMNTLFPQQEGEQDVAGGLKLVARDRIRTGAQPRTSFPPAEIEELAASIRTLREQGRGVAGTGLLQPPLVRAAPDGSGYIIISGERRLRACALVGLESIPVVVSSSEGEEDSSSLLLLQLIENMQRQDLPPLEEARGIEALMEGQNLSIREVARLLSKDKGYVQNRLFLLQAEPEIQAMIAQRPDTLRHARLIGGVKDPAQRADLIRAVLEENASLATLEGRLQPSKARKPSGRTLDTAGNQTGAGQASPVPSNTSGNTSGEDAEAAPTSVAATGAIEPDDSGQYSEDEDAIFNSPMKGHLIVGQIVGRSTQERAGEDAELDEQQAQELVRSQSDPLAQDVRPAAAHLAEATRQLDTLSLTPAYQADLRREIAAIRAHLDELESKLD